MSIKVLHINCHPLFDNDKHTTVKLSNHGLQLLKKIDGIELEVLNLYDDNFFLPKVNNALLGAWLKRGQDLTEDEDRNFTRQQELVKQWIEADYVFIYSPLHNFNVTSAFKDYVDNILIAGKTFKYTEHGSVGLLDNSNRIVYIQSSGGAYQDELRYINADIAPHYVRTILSFMGIEKMHLIRVEGLDLSGGDRENIINKGMAEIENYVNLNFAP